MYKITAFKSERIVKQGKLETYEHFRDLAERFRKVKIGDKLGSGWVRGELSAGVRADRNRKTSKLLIIDADCSSSDGNAISPKEASDRLNEIGLGHFIYTSHSHSKDVNKFRCVVACQEYSTNEELVRMLTPLVELLDLKFVKEMKAWSQIWFDPRRQEDDGLFEFYYCEGKEYEIDEIVRETKTEEGKSIQKGEAAETLEALYENIRSGKEYHESLRTITWQYYKDGMSNANNKAYCKSLMNSSVDAGSERWQLRYDEIDRLVDGIKDDSTFDIEIPVEEVIYAGSGFPKPPGMLGDLFDASMKFQLYPCSEVAIASSIGVIAGIVGRKFNIEEPDATGLNLFLTIIADTGIGKDKINSFINLCLRSAQRGIRNYDMFKAPDGFTGPKAIVNWFKDHRSGVSVMKEAGLMMKVRSGNVEGKTAYCLDAFQCAHRHGESTSQGFSDAESDMVRLKAMAMTIISESTSSQLMDAFRATGSLTNGHLPRQICLRVHHYTEELNTDILRALPEHLSDKLAHLCEKCSIDNHESDSNPYILNWDEDVLADVHKYMLYYRKLVKKHMGLDDIRSNMATRVAQIAIRLAGIATVTNKSAGESGCLNISWPEWKWAKAFCDYMYINMTETLSGLTKDDGMNAAGYQVCLKIIAILDNTIVDDKCKVNAHYRNAKLIPYSKLKIACKNSGKINDIGDKGGQMRSGLDKVIDDAVRCGAMKIETKDRFGKSPKLVQLMAGFNEYMRGFGI